VLNQDSNLTLPAGPNLCKSYYSGKVIERNFIYAITRVIKIYVPF